MTDGKTILGDVCKVIDCEHKTAPTEPEGIPLIRTPNIGRGRLDLDGVQRISERTYAEWTRRAEPAPGDLIMAREAPVGNVALIPAGLTVCLGQRTVLLRITDPEVNPGYLTYLLNSPAMQAYLRLLSNGATVGHLNLTDIRKLILPELPSPSVQRKLAAVLAAYDDLIENNTRRIALLERLAEGLYREWFVRMRFPGHEHVAFEKGIPTTWTARALGEVAAVNKRSIGRRNRPESIRYIDIGSVTTNQIHGARTMPFEEAPGRARRIVQHGDIIWSSVRPANRAYSIIYEPEENTVASTGFAVITPRSVPYSFLHFAVTTDSFVDWIAMVAKGAAYPATSFDDFKRAEVLIPDDDLLDAFHERCEPMLRQIHLLRSQNDKLAATRDLLLPRLISGALPVADLDVQLPPSMSGGDPAPDVPAPAPQADLFHA